jgi:hypothetical protein
MLLLMLCGWHVFTCTRAQQVDIVHLFMLLLQLMTAAAWPLRRTGSALMTSSSSAARWAGGGACGWQAVCTALAQCACSGDLSAIRATVKVSKPVGWQRTGHATLLAPEFAVLQRPCCFACHDVLLLPSLLLFQVAEIATLFDDDGILVRFMNSTTEGNCVRWVLHMSCHQSCTLLATMAPSVLVLRDDVHHKRCCAPLAEPLLLDIAFLPAC